jgi:hypothetical protein
MVNSTRQPDLLFLRGLQIAAAILAQAYAAITLAARAEVADAAHAEQYSDKLFCARQRSRRARGL